MTHEDITEVVALPVIDKEQDDECSLSVFEEDAPAPFKRVYLEDFSAPMTLFDAQRASYLRRFGTLFIDDVRMREGSTSNIFHATNAFGEQFALKVRKADATSAVDAASVADAAPLLDEAMPKSSDFRFEHEYEAHRMLSDIKGYPKLYGKARLDGHPVLVMEWIEGEDLLLTMARMAVDGSGRLSPLTAARLGRDIFDVLARTSVLESEIAHGDISLRNIMISTSRQSVDEQMQEGVFDVRLIDLSSAHMSSNVSSHGGINGDESLDDWCYGAATPQFAAPEVRSYATPAEVPTESESASGPASVSSASEKTAESLKCTQASDVYAVASILCLLIYGDAAPSFIASRARTAHDGGDDLLAVLHREPEVAVALHRTILELSSTPSAQEMLEALSQVDEPLMALMRSCLAKDPKKRPSAEEMRDALESFCVSYVPNIGRALCGDVLEPCRAPFINKGVKRISLRVRNLIRDLGKSFSIGLGTAVAATMAVLIQIKPLTFEADTLKLEGIQSELLVVLLFLPIALGLLVRGTRRDSVTSLVRGTIGIALGVALLMSLTNVATFDPEAYESVYRWAIFAISAVSWCPFVLDAAFPVHAPRVRRRLRALPDKSRSSNLSKSSDVSGLPDNRAELLESLNVKANGSSDPDGELYDEVDDICALPFQEGVNSHDER